MKPVEDGNTSCSFPTLSRVIDGRVEFPQNSNTFYTFV